MNRQCSNRTHAPNVNRAAPLLWNWYYRLTASGGESSLGILDDGSDFRSAASGGILTSMPLTSIEPRRLYRQIAEQIRGLIASGEYVVGARLPPERDLAKQLRVSRPSVREALIALEVEGLIEVRVGSGIYVHAPAPGSAQALHGSNGAGHPPGPFELIRARRAIEGECAAIAAKEAKRGQVAQIAEALQQMEDHAGQMAQPLDGDRNARNGISHPLGADREFHLRIAEATNNAALAQVVRHLWDERGGPLFTKLQHHFNTPRSWSSAISEHTAVYDAIRAHDPGAARAAMHHHMDRASRRFSKSWGDGGK